MSMMGKEMKVCLPLYKVLYSLAFVVILSIARGVTHTYEVGIACEAPMALLASVFCADTYVQEITSRRSEVWRLYPMKRKVMCIFRRIGIQQCYLLLLGAWNMFSYTFRDIGNGGDLNWIKGKALCACLCIIMALAAPKIIRKRG